jgi:hypothetical protein
VVRHRPPQRVTSVLPERPAQWQIDANLDDKGGEIHMRMEKEVSKASIAEIVGLSSTNLHQLIRNR